MCYPFQGYETSALMISYAILMLAMHPEYQERVFEEVKLIFPDNTLDNTVNYEDLNNLEFTERVIKETMRLFPAVPVMARNATAAFDMSTFCQIFNWRGRERKNETQCVVY